MNKFFDKFLIGSVMIICGILLLIINYGKPFNKVEDFEDSLLLAYIFVLGGIIYILFKAIQKR